MIILIPITAILCAWIWFGVFRMPERYEFLNRKPFSCSMCFSMWLSAILYFCPNFVTELLFVTSSTSALAAWLENLNSK
jgi:hypothetical protein